MFKKNIVFILVLTSAIIFAVSAYSVRFYRDRSIENQSVKEAVASSSQAVLTSQSDWTTGTNTNTDTASSVGSVKIALTETEVNLQSNSGITVDMADADKGKAIDADEGTAWNGNTVAEHWYKIDMGQSYSFSKFRTLAWTPRVITIQVSADDVSYSTVGTGGSVEEATWQNYDPALLYEGRYIKLILSNTGIPDNGSIYEIEAYQTPGTATHTSASTQITNTNLYQWQTLTPTYTQPANTTVSFRFRTSTDANTWTSWTAYQTPNSGSSLDITSLVTSKTGDAGSETFYKYIQVETKLTSANGTSNPTVDDYSIGYHTNVVPNKPVGATVTMGS